MWKRVYLATVRGPDLGHAIELGTAGRALPAAPSVVIGRGTLADHKIADPALLPIHLTAQAGVNLLGMPGAWVTPSRLVRPAWGVARRRRHVLIGQRFRHGGSTFEVRTDARPTLASPGHASRMMLRSLPLAGGLGFVAMWLIPGAGPWPLVASAVLTPAAMLLASRTASRRLPDPAEFRRGHTSAPRPETGEGWLIDVGNATHRGRRAKNILLTSGDVLGISGPGATGLHRWVSAQLMSRGGELRGGQPGAQITVVFAHAHEESQITVLTAPTPTLLPRGVSVSVTARAGHNRAVSEAWFAAATPARERAALPTSADLRAHLPTDVAEAWRAADAEVSTPIGVGLGEAGLDVITINLAKDSPHAVIAGTTGAGKSELLTAWLLGLAMRYPPARVTMALVDYKGGATFGALARLPHVLDVLTDLDHEGTIRALESLRVEILRRERLFREAGVSHLRDYNAQGREPLARLIIAVDEFRVLADEYPKVLEQVMRVAAQGRSLGLHVILATQRPGGTITADIRANMGLRACLRVLEDSDSMDILGTAAAARLPAIPGRMILQEEGPRTVQTLWAGDSCSDLVDVCCDAAATLPHLARVHRPWAPPLPAHLPEVLPAPPGEITLGLADLPAQQRHGPWHIRARGLLAISGVAGSGRSNAARVVAFGLLRAGIAVHTISEGHLLAGASSHADPTDPPACYSLLTALGEARGPDALVVDDLSALLETLDAALGMGEAAGFLGEVLRAARRRGAFVVITTQLTPPTWLLTSDRIVFPPADPQQRLLAGLTAQGRPGPPGRAVAVHAGRETPVQISHLPSTAEVTVAPAASFKIQPLPTRVDVPADPALGICIGIGGTTNEHVVLPCKRGRVTLILAPPGTGKTHLGTLITARAVLAGRPSGEVIFLDDAHLAEPADLDAHAAALQHGAHLVVAMTPEGLSAGFHPLLARARQAEHTIYASLMPRAAVGVPLARYITPGIVGRVALAHRGRLIPVQIDAGAHLR